MSVMVERNFGSAVFADVFFVSRMLCKSVLPCKKVGDNSFSRNSRRNYSWTRNSLAAFACTAVEAPTV